MTLKSTQLTKQKPVKLSKKITNSNNNNILNNNNLNNPNNLNNTHNINNQKSELQFPKHQVSNQEFKSKHQESKTQDSKQESKLNKLNNLDKLKKIIKIIVIIPAYNEEKTIAKVIAEIPRKINDTAIVKVLVIDDGSIDRTVEVSKQAGADFILRNPTNLGLAQTFQKGIDKAVELGADIIVNTDADFQYNQTEIPKLIRPILYGEADIVSGNRQVEGLDHMKASKKYGNILGTKVVKWCAGYEIKDASSGFRAYSKEAALRLFVISKHTYTHETLIQARHKNLRVVEVPVEFRKREGSDSKLIKSVFSHIKKSMATIVRNTLMYNSMKVLGYLGALLILIGLVPILRWIYLTYIIKEAGQHIQSLIFGLLFMLIGTLIILLGFMSDLIAINRRHLEEILYRTRKNSSSLNDIREINWDGTNGSQLIINEKLLNKLKEK